MAYDEPKVFAGSGGTRFARRICAYLGVELGRSETIRFSEGNIFVRILENVRDRDIYLVQSIALRPNDEFVEILFWIDAFRRASARTVTLIMPYFGYARGDKQDEPRVSIRARVCADAIELAGVDRVVTMDLHAPQIQGFFKKPVNHLYAMPVLCAHIRRLGLNLFNLVVVAPDAGRAKVARMYAAQLGVPVAIADKTRYAHDETAHLLEVIGDVDGRDALVVDDMSLSGSTLIAAARGLKQRGARRVLAMVTHLGLNPDAVKRVEESPVELLIATDTVDNPVQEASHRVRIVSVAPLFAEAVRRIHSRDSVSALFDNVPESVIQASALDGEPPASVEMPA